MSYVMAPAILSVAYVLPAAPRHVCSLQPTMSAMPPREMRLKAVKEELDSFGVAWRGIFFEKDDLVRALEYARANPSPPPPRAKARANPSPPPPAAWAAAGFGAESPAPGREKEYEANQARSGADGMGGNVPPPVDAERRNRSPGIGRNFYDVSTADFKRSHGGGEPPAPQGPPSANAQASARYGAEPTTRAQDDKLEARVARLEQSNAQLEIALSETKETARREAAEARAREEGLLQRLAALEARRGRRGYSQY